MQIRKILFTLSILFTATAIEAAPAFSVDSAAIFASEARAIQQGINFEKNRIAYHYKTADRNFFRLVDSVYTFISEQDISVAKRNHYHRRLQIFLQNIHRSYSERYFKSGTYFASLSYFPMLIEWNESGELLQNIKHFSSFSIKAIRLIPNDTVAEDFLLSYLRDYPDDIFRYAVEFDDRKFALHVLEEAVKFAPESAQRYYTTVNTVNTILSKSDDLSVKISYEIFNRFGTKSKAFLLLPAIVNNKMSIGEADSIGRNTYRMFHLLVELEYAAESQKTYSSDRYIYNYCMDVMRKINSDGLDLTSQQNIFNRYPSEELFVLMCYGHKEASRETFIQLLKTIQRKTSGSFINGIMLSQLNKGKLKELLHYCDTNQMRADLLNLVDDERKNYLLALDEEKPKEVLLPVFKTFRTEKSVAENQLNSKSGYQVLKNPSPASAGGKNTLNKSLKTNQASTLQTTSLADPSDLLASNGDAIPISLSNTDVAPIPFLEPVEPVNIILDEKTRTILSLKKNILQTIQSIPSFIKQDYAEQLLNYAAQKEPDELFKKIDAFKDNRFSKTILEQCAVNAPVSLKRYLYNSKHQVNYILQYSSNPVVKKIFEINPQIDSRSKPLLLLDDIISGKLSVKDAIAISSEPDKLFHALVKIISHPQYVGKYSIDHEIRDYSLRFIREINDKIATGESLPYYSAENFSSGDLYFLMLYGRDEVFTSTFNGLFSRFIQKLPNKDGNAFLRSVNYNQFRDFLSLCSSFGTLEEFLNKFSDDTKQKLLVSYISNLEAEKDDLSTIVLIAEAISNLNDNQLLSLLHTNIKKEYDRVKNANDQIGISIYGILSSMISGNAKVETKWYKRVSEQFKISPVGALVSSSLFSEGKVCIQQMYFYNDDDGRSSFFNFMNSYKNQPAWIIEDQKNYVRIYSREGMHIEVFANKPEFEESGVTSINEYLREKIFSPSVIIHRGHSFHTESTLERTPSSAKLVFVGSCGGFYKVSMALENAPEAHIISTKQIGTKTINDAMLFALNENIRVGKDIIWNDFWEKMRLKLGHNQYFSDYIPPNKNLEAIFIRAYYKLLGV